MPAPPDPPPPPDELPDAAPDAAPDDAAPIEVPAKSVPPPLPAGRGVAAEIRSLERHVCPKCGGKGEWDPGKAQLVCPYCGNAFERVAPPPPPASIVEHDLDEMVARLGDKAAALDTASRRVECAHCHAVLVRGAGTVAQHCDFCGSPELLDYQDLESPVPPESLLPATVSKEQAYHSLKGFLGSRWFAPGDLKRRNLVDRMHRVYLPYWTFDAAAECPWSAESGTYYYVSVSGRDANGRPVTRQERRVRWRPASGHVSTWFDDLLVSGSRGLDSGMLREIEPFATGGLVPYETRYVSGWQVEHYQIPLLQAARTAFGTMEEMLREMCAREVPGDTYRNLRIRPEFSRKTFKHILAPVWLLSYSYRGRTWQGVVNAVTGKARARFPISPWKVALVVVLALVVLVALVYLLGAR